MKKLFIAIAFLLCCSTAFANPFMGMISSGSGTSSCSATYGSEIHTAANAASLTNEANATTGITSSGLASFTSVNTDPHNGSYHLEATANSDIDRMYYSLSSLTAGTLYEASVWIRYPGSGGDWGVGFANTSVPNTFGPLTISQGSPWTEWKKIFAYSPAQQINIMVSERSATNDGTVYVDGLSIKPVTPCLGDELYGVSNAISSLDVNAYTGLTTVDGAQISVSNEGAADGTYHVLISANETPTSYARAYISLSSYMTAGNRYLVTFFARHSGTGGAWICGYGSGTTGALTCSIVPVANTATTYAKHGMELTYDSNFSYLVFRENSATNDGSLYIDGLTIKEILD